MVTVLVAELSGCGRAATPAASPPAAPPASETAPRCAPGDPSYTAQVQPLVDRYCSSCHSPNGDAGEEHDFTHFETLQAQRRLVSARLRFHSMPPRTSPQPALAEAALLVHWADCGAARD
ncbi:MAG TPA: hypothetical protein VEQ59_22740 [Polyangiaceae bacterium]|nr:hypothetical protein [Polyangiaceae bacterium]